MYNEEDFFNVHIDVDGAFILDYLASRLATYYKKRPELIMDFYFAFSKAI